RRARPVDGSATARGVGGCGRSGPGPRPRFHRSQLRRQLRSRARPLRRPDGGGARPRARRPRAIADPPQTPRDRHPGRRPRPRGGPGPGREMRPPGGATKPGDLPPELPHDVALKVLTKGVTDGITILDAAGRLLYVNEVAAAAAGYAGVDEMMANPSAWMDRIEFQ